MSVVGLQKAPFQASLYEPCCLQCLDGEKKTAVQKMAQQYGDLYERTLLCIKVSL